MTRRALFALVAAAVAGRKVPAVASAFPARSVRYIRHWDPGKDDHTVRMDVLYGVSRGHGIFRVSRVQDPETWEIEPC